MAQRKEVKTLDNAPRNSAANQPVKVARLRRIGIYATGIFAALLIGFVAMWLVARTRANERDAAQQALRLTGIKDTLAAAIHA